MQPSSDWQPGGQNIQQHEGAHAAADRWGKGTQIGTDFKTPDICSHALFQKSVLYFQMLKKFFPIFVVVVI